MERMQAFGPIRSESNRLARRFGRRRCFHSAASDAL